VLELCGSSARLDHAYGIIMRPGTNGLGLPAAASPSTRPSSTRSTAVPSRTGWSPCQWALVDHIRVAVSWCARKSQGKLPPARRDRRGYGRRGPMKAVMS